jgi:hypothetical protein
VDGAALVTNGPERTFVLSPANGRFDEGFSMRAIADDFGVVLTLARKFLANKLELDLVR